MNRRGRIARIIGGAAVVGAVVAVGVLGFVGVERTVIAGTQVRMCGTSVGVSVVEPGRAVQLLGVSDAPLAAGDRARAHALCVVEVVRIEGADGQDAGAETDADGAQATVHLRWRLW
ncbi:hypothetical protein [Leucobacter sp. NPDC077196]|uniref:hypothetical protein n=1 Tax=Leucobacter sp. NPDC077196 TaxID=3154959 RepID=UPI0034340B46